MNKTYKRIPAIITATTASPQFPGRAFLKLGDKDILSVIVDKFRQIPVVDKIILCTSNKSIDNDLAGYAKKLGIITIKGDYDNILRRLMKAYIMYNIEDAFVIRGDYPLFDIEYSIKLYEIYRKDNAEYACNEHLKGLPYGTGIEIISVEALNKVFNMRAPEIYNERFTAFINLHKKTFKISKLTFENPKPDLRFVVESEGDYEFVKALISLNDNLPNVRECIETVEKHPYLKTINKPDADVKEIGLNKIFLFPDKVKNIFDGKDDLFPISVELTLTNNCNLNCSWCSDKALRKNHPGSLSFQNYKRLVDDLSENGTKGLVIEGGGEPTIYPRFTDALDYALESGLSVGLITNGVLFNYSEYLDRMEWVRISLDSDSPENFKQWKGADQFYQVLHNIKKMCEHKGSCVIGIGYVVTKYNIDNLEEIVILLSDYGVDYIYLRPVIDNPDLKIEENLYYLEKYNTDSFSVMIHAMEENSINGNSHVPCRSHSLSSVIGGDGAVYLCGRLNIHDWVNPIGNINEESFLNIWHGNERKNQIEMVKNKNFCSQYCPECRLTKYNILLNNAGKIKTRNFI